MPSEHDDFRAERHARIEIDDVLVHHADAARRNSLADTVGLGGAVDAITCVLSVLEQIERAGAERIARAAFHALRQFGVAVGVTRDHRRGRRPVRPLLLLLHRARAGKGEPLAADADTVTDRPVAALDQIEKTLVWID